MSNQRDTIVGVVWLVVGAVLLVGFIAGGAKVLSDPSSEQFFRLTMAAFFLGGSFAYLTRHHRRSLLRFFKR